jgi:hypothetical protein
LFKKIYNLSCEEKKSLNLQIDKNKINDYDLDGCIKENIKDINGRYLLIETDKSHMSLIYQTIKIQNPLKDVIMYEGSDFGEDKNKEYRYGKIYQIQKDAKDEKIIIIENLDQIHAFLFDLYNRNFQIIENKKMARICLDNFDEQLIEINSKFRIIILVDKTFMKNCSLAFLNRFEKIQVEDLNKILNKEIRTISQNLIEEFNLVKRIEKYNFNEVNYLINDLLINCRDQDIQGLIYILYNLFKEKNKNNDNQEQKEEKIDENKIREDVVNKVYKILAQDVIAILPKNNIIKKKYLDSEIYNSFKDYIVKDDYKKYKISIIYSFTSISKVEGLNLNISEIRSEKGFKNKIEELKISNGNNQLKKYDYICVHFDQNNSKKMKFITNLIINDLNEKNEENIHYIIIVHINRNFSEKKEKKDKKDKKEKVDKIYSLPDINPDINQLFIDNLEINNNITLKDFLSKDLKTILEEKKEELNLEEEFYKTLKNFLKKEIDENNNLNIDKNNKTEYIKGIIGYIKDNKSIKEKIINATYKLIEENKDDENLDEIIDKIFRNKLVNKFTVDIVTCIIDYIKEEIFNKYLIKILKVLEDNNILTTLSELYQKDFDSIDKNVVEEIVKEFLEKITFDTNINYNCKFFYNFNIPGFYNFYLSFSDYIKNNISKNYFDNEKTLRYLLKEDAQKILEFHNKEDELLENAYKEIEKNKFVFDNIKKISSDLIFKDYVTYYLKKYKYNFGIYNKDDIYHKIIELLLSLRFNKENRIMKGDNKINILLIKIIWIESNVNYILNIYKIIEKALNIYGNYENENESKEILYKTIDALIKKDNIKYITNKKKNPKHTKEVNECFYKLLASFCYSITSDEIKLVDISDICAGGDVKMNEGIKIEINEYCHYLNDINKIMQNLNDELLIFLNEMYIIDELIKIIEIFKKIQDDTSSYYFSEFISSHTTYQIQKINEIKNIIRENAEIIQQYALIKDQTQLSEKLVTNFEEMYNRMTVIEENKDKDYYDKLGYILFKEIKKVTDISYRYKILEKILLENEIIKKSNNIFQILLKNYLKIEKYKDNRKKILDGDDNIIKLLEKEIPKNFVLRITLLYLFEKNSLIYIQNILANKKDKNKEKIYLDDEPLIILKECIESLNNFLNNKEKKKDSAKNKETSKLFSLSYIKTFISIFIKMFQESEPKWKDPSNIINVINEDNNICKMIRIYIYKILYNEYKIDFFLDEENISKYKLEDYKDYSDFIQIEDLNNLYKIDYKIKTIKDGYYSDASSAIDKCRKDDFKKEIKSSVYDLDEYGIDNFYMASFNLILLNSQLKKEEINKNFFNNICKPLFKQKKLLLKAIELFYNSEKFEEIKRTYEINDNNSTSFLFGYRFCLNTIFSKNEKGVYYLLYEADKIDYLKEKFYPGNDAKINLVYSKILNHFKTKPEEGCYVCLCKGWYYHSIPSGFPGKNELNKVCPKCSKNIGLEKKGFFSKEIKMVKRDGYYRILKDKKEEEKMKKNPNLRDKLKEINYITLDEFKKKFLDKAEKGGIYSSDIKNFKNNKKVIRNLSQVVYRLLNYILYSNLFFAKLILNKNDFDNYKPKNMEWGEILSESWNILKNELLKENIDSIEEFMNNIFSDLFLLLNSLNVINKYEDLIQIENNLEQEIRKLIKNFIENETKNDTNENEIEEDKTSSINLLKEKYLSEYYDKNEFPFYEYLYYTDYLNEKYIYEKLSLFDESEYPLLKLYLDNKINENNDENKYNLENLLLFNKVLNLIYQTYNNNISRAQAEKKKLCDEEIYIQNKDDINKFIKFYNSLNIDDNELKPENTLNKFFVDDTNKYGEIYNNFIEQYNPILKKLLETKIEKGLLDADYEGYSDIQKINEKELFTFNLPKKNPFIEILFNASHRKILDVVPINHKLYKEYVIDYDYIEDTMTELMLKNKKLLNKNITEFIYNNEVFNNQITNIITLLRGKYKDQMSIYDKVAIYKFCTENKNQNMYKNILNDFITLIKFLNSKEKENEVKAETKIYEVINDIKDSTSKNFIKLFKEQNDLKIGKSPEIFDYYLKVISEDIIKEIKNYQVNLDKKTKDEINNYFKGKHHIDKKDLAYAIRLFMSLVLFNEEEKNKIKTNNNNIVKYLYSPDLWKKVIYDDADNLNKNLSDLKLMNIKINQIKSLYETLGKDIENNYFDEVKKIIEKEKKGEEEEEEEEEEKNKSESEDDDREF